VREMRRIIIAGAIGLVLIVLLSISPHLSSHIKIRVAEVFTPVQKVFYAAFSHLGGVAEGIGRVIRAARLNRSLEEENIFLTREVLRLKEVEKENQGLRALLDFKKKSPYRNIPAQVVGRDIRNWYQSILIDKGTAEGVEKDAAVVSARGVVGRIIEVAPHTSRVLLIVDRNSRVGGVLQSSRLSGIVEGLSGDICVIRYLPRRSEIEPGEEVLTSGLSRIYPPGLRIGKITRVYSEKFEYQGQYADLAPAVDFDRLTRVMVLVEQNQF